MSFPIDPLKTVAPGSIELPGVEHLSSVDAKCSAVSESVMGSGASSLIAAPLVGRVSSPEVLGTDAAVPNVVFGLEGMDFKTADSFIRKNAGALRLGPDLIHPSDVERLSQINKVYKIRQNQEAKEAFRNELIEQLHTGWIAAVGAPKAAELRVEFIKYAEHFDKNGVGIFGDLIANEDFSKLISSYSKILTTEGNKTWLHSFVDLRSHPDFLMNPEFNGAFLHPLNIALVAYKMGGPIRVTDARGKDAEPIAAVTLDNMLHIDNVPFAPEVKQTLFWRQGKPVGPNGQCFVCLPGTHQCPRAPDGVLIDGKPVPFSTLDEKTLALLTAAPASGDEKPVFYTTEAGSVFRTPRELEGALKAQQVIIGSEKPLVVALRDETRVITATAETGNLVHHRYRLKEGDPRSCLLVAFHLVEDDPGQLVTPERLAAAKARVGGSELDEFLLGTHARGDPQLNNKFLRALTSQTGGIATMLDGLKTTETSGGSGAAYISPESKALTSAEVIDWKDSVLHGPGTERIKRDQHILVEGQTLSHKEFIDRIKHLMAYDKTGVLELILYSDGREEKRKWARNQIRELRLESPGESRLDSDPRAPSLDARFEFWASRLNAPKSEDLIGKDDLALMANEMVGIIQEHIDRKTVPSDDLHQKIAPELLFAALQQFVGDLGIAIQNCSNRETFVSTELFMFWACDTIMRVLPSDIDKSALQRIGDKLLGHYVAISVVVEKQAKGDVSIRELDSDSE